MFKKKKKENNLDTFDFKDIDSELSDEQAVRKKPSLLKRGLLTGAGVLMLSGVVYAVGGNDVETPSTDESKPIVEEDIGFTGTTDEMKDGEEAPSEPVEPLKDKETTAFDKDLPDGFVSYLNGYADIKFGYSDTWLLEEKTQNSLDVVSANTKEGKMGLKNAKYGAMLEIASLTADGGTVFVSVIPTKFAKEGVWQDGLIETNKDNIKASKGDSVKSKTGSFVTTSVTYKQYGEERKGKQYQQKLKDGVLTVQLVVTKSDDYEQFARDTDSLVESVTFN